jgi:hypothetical protein
MNRSGQELLGKKQRNPNESRVFPPQDKKVCGSIISAATVRNAGKEWRTLPQSAGEQLRKWTETEYLLSSTVAPSMSLTAATASSFTAAMTVSRSPSSVRGSASVSLPSVFTYKKLCTGVDRRTRGAHLKRLSGDSEMVDNLSNLASS